MKVKQKITALTVSLFILTFMGAVFSPAQTYAADESAATPASEKYCGGVKTSLIACDKAGDKTTDISETGLWGILVIAINILTAGVGVAALGGVVYGATLYTTAAGKADQIKKAIEVFRNVVIGVVAFALMYAGLNFLIPGGLIN